ncbi:MAG TPA: PIN domain-containing protein [Candidatus Limnocylindrales bacterium]|nr:PIN domain-containing protein [Candidatus Limnocylindrales bacterium]
MHLFIDTNIFLSFYHLTSDDLEELRKLAVLLEQKKVVLYLTDQVVVEFQRNRDGKIADALKGLKDQRLSLQFPQLCKDYAEYAELRALQKKYEDAHGALLEKVSQDVASATLKADETIRELFAKATRIETVSELVAKAKLRFEIGNPPGKDGSLGDAINWEALLEHVPVGNDLHFITDDRDYVSVLDENQFKGFLLNEWIGHKKSAIRFYRRLSSFFKDHFPQINLASELEKEFAIQALAASRNFSQTHEAIAQLAKYTQFTGTQVNDIMRAAVSNRQVFWIIKDQDVDQFLRFAILGHEKDIEGTNFIELQRLFAKNQPVEEKVIAIAPF